jgi:hypothetical protein
VVRFGPAYLEVSIPGFVKRPEGDFLSERKALNHIFSDYAREPVINAIKELDLLRAQLRHNNLNSVTQFVSGLNKSFGAFREFLSKSASNILEFKSDSRKIIFYMDAKLDYESALIQDDSGKSLYQFVIEKFDDDIAQIVLSDIQNKKRYRIEGRIINDDNWWLHSAEPPEFDPGEN